MTNANHPLPEQKENVRHGEMAFPIQKYQTRLGAEIRSISPHWHEEAELTMITEGNCLCGIQLESTVLEKGDLVFAPPQVLHSFARGTEEMTSQTFVFHMNLLGGGTGDVCTIRYLAPLSSQKIVPPMVIRQDHALYPQARELFVRLNQIWEEKKPGYELLVKAQLLTFLAVLIPHSSKDMADITLRTEQAQKIKTALEFMELHHAEEISIADIAAACYFSQYHFMRFFKKHMGVSCGEYLKNLRLEKAAREFAAGSREILDVAMNVGFHNLSYFYREFQKKYGMTPKQFINKCAELPVE